MNNFMEWVKGNVIIVVFIVIMVAAPVGMWFFTSGLNSDVKAEVQKRAGNLTPLASLKKVQIEIPGQESTSGVINDKFIEEYTRFANAVGQDADAVRTAAIEHNRKGRDVLMKDVFPTMPAHQRETLPFAFCEALAAAYAALIKDINAGSPPALESLRDELTRTRSRFITQKLQKDVNDTLTDDEMKSLKEALALRRLDLYNTAADSVSLYLTRESLNTAAPLECDQRMLPTPTQLFQWQWEYWVLSDVLRALAEANKADQKVYRSPIKRVQYVASSVPGAASPSSGGGRPGAGVGNPSGASDPSAGFDDDGSGGGSGAAPPMGSSGDPKMQVAFDYNASITGRKSNPLYDVINVDLELIVETARLPQVIDALSKYNFITVSSLTVKPADPAADSFSAAREGYIYGSAPVSLVSMRLETVWLRQWIAPLMPDDLKKSLNIPVPAKPAAPGSSESSDAELPPEEEG